MADDEPESSDEATESSENGGEEKSFRERVEEIRQKRAEEGEGEGEELSREERMEEMMGGGGPGGMGGGGNPFAQMMGGMMGGGGPGGPGGMGGAPGQAQEGGGDNEELTREIRKLRDEVHDMRRTLDRIADALED